MRKVLLVSLCLNGLFAVGLFWKGLPVHAGDREGILLHNGDIDGNGRIEITDAIRLLGFLYLGEAAPIPIPTFSATGQTNCYDADGTEIACDAGGDFHGQDGYYKLGCPTAGRFRENGDGTVTDNCTGLIWQRHASPLGLLTWRQALSYCESLDIAGIKGWRLPNVAELESLVNYGSDTAIDPVFQEPSSVRWYWSSTTIPTITKLARVVLFGAFFSENNDSGTSVGDKNAGFYVRAVRNAP